MRKRLEILVPLLVVCTTFAIGATVNKMANLNQFNSGEVSGLLEGRTDYQKYNASARTLQNMIVRSQGPVQRRPGLKWISTVKDSNDQARLIPFEYSTEDAYAIELGDLYARFYRDASPVLDANGVVYEIATPWDSNDLFDLHYAQDAEYLRVVHPNYAPHKIWRASANHADWRCEKIKFVDGPFLDENTQVGVTLTAGSTGDANGHDYYKINEEASVLLHGANWYAQTFTASKSYTATGVKLKLLRVGSLPGEVAASLRATSGSLPTGADLTSGVVDGNTVTTNIGGEWKEFVFSSPQALTGSTEYAIVYRAVDATPTDYIRWRLDVDPATTYTNGQVCVSGNSGSTWAAGTADAMFKVVAQDVNSSTTSTTVNASADIFDPLHVGSIWQISHQEDGAAIRGTFTTTEWRVQAGGASDQNSATITVYEDQDYAITCVGFWAGTLLIQRSVNNGVTWDTVYAYTKGAQTEPGLVFTGTETEEDALYRLQMKDLVGYRPHRNDYYLSFPYTLISLPFTRQGVVEITGYTDPNTVDVSIRKSLGAVTGTSIWAEGAWSDYRGWPRTVEYHEQRCLYGGSRSWPQTIWASITATKDSEYDDFDEGPKNDPAADDAWTYVLPGMSPIQWMKSADFLMIGTTKAVGRLGTETEAITPLVSPPYRTQAKNGSAYIQPVDAVDALLYVERGGEKVRELTYTYASDRFIAPDMTILAQHITGTGLIEIAFQNRPDPILWAIREDGYALSLTYERKQEVLAWARHNTGQDVNDWNDIDLFESVTVIPGSGTTPSGDTWVEDAVYFIVNRTIDGNDYRLVEVMTPMDWGADEDWAWFVDGGISGNSSGVAETGGGATTYTMSYISENGAIWGIPLGDRAMLSGPDANDVNDVGGGIVGIPYTAHPFSSGDVIRIAGSTNYTGTHTLTAGTSANELQFSDTYTPETFDGTEQIYEYINVSAGYGRFIVDANYVMYYGHSKTGSNPNVTYVTRLEPNGVTTADYDFLTTSSETMYQDGFTGDCRGLAVSTDANDLFMWLNKDGATDHGYMHRWNLATGDLKWESSPVVGVTSWPGYDMCIDDANNAYAPGTNGSEIIQFAAADGAATELALRNGHASITNAAGAYCVEYDSAQDKLVVAGYQQIATGFAYTDFFNVVVMDTDGTNQVEILAGNWWDDTGVRYTSVVKSGCLAIDSPYIYVLADVNGTTPTIYKYDFAGNLQASVAGPTYAVGLDFNAWGDLIVINQDWVNYQDEIFWYYDTDLNYLTKITGSYNELLRSWDASAGGPWIQGSILPNGTVATITYGVDVNDMAVAHLPNTEVCVYADGIPRGQYTVSADPNGTQVINLGANYSVVVAGLNYYSIYESLPIVNSQSQGRMTMLKDVVVDYYETMGSHVGTSYTYSADLKFSYDNWATGISPYTGFKGPVGLLSALNRDPTIYIWEWDPLPMCIRSINTTQEITMP